MRIFSSDSSMKMHKREKITCNKK